jgi:phosphohistidine phosphatase
MLIYFLRHGDASSHSRFDDNERPLTDLGKQQAVFIGKFLLQTKTRINIIITSPLVRACETGAIVQSLINAAQVETSDYLINGTHPKHLFKKITELDVESVLLVGHEPFLSGTISLLLGRNHITDIEMKKCSLALVEILQPLRSGTGTLKQLIPVETVSKFIQL